MIDIEKFFGHRLTPIVLESLQKALLQPVQDILSRPAKGFRSQVVEIGFLLATPQNLAQGIEQKLVCESLGRAIEMVHAGSLIIDDIHDKSTIRRGESTLHLKYGLSIALNAGNWLYFWPLVALGVLNLSPDRQILLYNLMHKTLTLAHFGQALDIGIQLPTIPQDKVRELCISSMELKSGELVSAALVMGALIGGASQAQLSILENFGRSLGLVLQMFDDLGNIIIQTKNRNKNLKKFEDLILKRPSWIWAMAAHHCSTDSYANFISAIEKFPDPSFIISWLEQHPVYMLGKQEAVQTLDSAFLCLRQTWAQEENKGWIMLEKLIFKLKSAYVGG